MKMWDKFIGVKKRYVFGLSLIDISLFFVMFFIIAFNLTTIMDSAVTMQGELTKVESSLSTNIEITNSSVLSNPEALAQMDAALSQTEDFKKSTDALLSIVFRIFLIFLFVVALFKALEYYIIARVMRSSKVLHIDNGRFPNLFWKLLGSFVLISFISAILSVVYLAFATTVTSKLGLFDELTMKISLTLGVILVLYFVFYSYSFVFRRLLNLKFNLSLFFKRSTIFILSLLILSFVLFSVIYSLQNFFFDSGLMIMGVLYLVIILFFLFILCVYAVLGQICLVRD